MGYRFNWAEFVNGVHDAIYEIKMNDLIGWLRRRLESLSLESHHSVIVALVQNLESFSQLLGPEISGNRYNTVLDVIFKDENNARLQELPILKEGGQVRISFEFTRPHTLDFMSA